MMITKVEIQAEAFKKILSHALRFGNEHLEEPSEVLGVCLGSANSQESSFDIKNVIPLIHGDQIEIGLSKELHDLLENIKNEYDSSEDNSLKILGWYVSHPGYDLDFTDAEKTIQLYFQNDKNPNAICIILDPLKIKNSEDFGLKSFKLNDYKNPETSLELETNIKAPKTLNYFIWVKELIENSQRKEPQIILEYEESKKPVSEDLQEIPISKEKSQERQKFEEKVDSLMSGLDSGKDAFIEDFAAVYRNQIMNWTTDVRDGSLKGTEFLRSSLNQLNKTIEKGMEGLEGYFKTKFDEISSIFVKGITESLENSIKSQKELDSSTNAINQKISSNIEKLINDNFVEINNRLNSKMIDMKSKIDENSKKVERINDLISNNTGKVSEIHSFIENFSEDMVSKIKNSFRPFEKKLVSTIEIQDSNFIPINERYEEIEQLIEKLQKLISDIRQIK